MFETMQHLQPLLQEYGAFGLFGLLTLETLGLPVPGETALTAAAAAAGAGKLNIWSVVLAAASYQEDDPAAHI